MRFVSSSTAIIPCLSKFVLIVVTDGLMSLVISISSHPITLTSLGTFTPPSLSAAITPIALKSFAAKIASGKGFPVSKNAVTEL